MKLDDLKCLSLLVPIGRRLSLREETLPLETDLILAISFFQKVHLAALLQSKKLSGNVHCKFADTLLVIRGE